VLPGTFLGDIREEKRDPSKPISLSRPEGGKEKGFEIGTRDEEIYITVPILNARGKTEQK